jgi:hypothetical protein
MFECISFMILVGYSKNMLYINLQKDAKEYIFDNNLYIHLIKHIL